jgi:F420-non-reducing hydrogenase iron-sulfur subunit
MRVMCTGRIDLAHILKAFISGVDGVFIGGCRLNECNYTTQGNFHALNLVFLFKKIMEHLGLNPERLRIEFMSSGDGNIFAQVVDAFNQKVQELGPLGKSEGMAEESLRLKLKAVERLVPYLRLVEGERLRAHFKTLEECATFYSSAEADELFRALIADKLALSQIFLLLQDKARTTKELAALTGLPPAEITRHLNSSAELGLLKYTESARSFAAV